MMKWLLLILASAAPMAAQCTYTVTPTAVPNVPANGASGSISVNTQTNCAWGFSTNVSWITLSSANAANGQVTGSGVLNYTISASTLPTSEQGSIFISGPSPSVNIPVTQGAAVCSMTLMPASNTISAAGGPSSFGVQTSCSWTATSNANWITVSSPSTGTSGGTMPSVTGTGNGTVPFTVAPNGCVNPQTGTITVTSQPSQVFTLTESGSPNNLTLSPTTASVPQAGVSGRFNVVTGVGCGWTSFSDVGWLTITTAAGGTGNGGIGYTIGANTGPARAGNIHVGSQLFAVTQAGVALPPSS